MNEQNSNDSQLLFDPRFGEALKLFNSAKWYPAHDALEELWHETNGPERNTLQGLLQVAVAQVHLESGNSNGATILYGEGLGRLKRAGTPNLGLDLEHLCSLLEQRLKSLQRQENIEVFNNPLILERS
tara:strand:- start:200 stop:583 length:384 start_codon:yes stop_codon:yes gene_type:complete